MSTRITVTNATVASDAGASKSALESLAATLPEWPTIAERYHYWQDFMAHKVAFNQFASEAHTKQHAARVLLHALVIGARRGLRATDLDVLGAAAAFHDARRQDDWLDTGHGQRAADYYRTFCADATNNLSFDQRVYLTMAFHDRDDELGREAFAQHGLAESTILYSMFKDADGLDRFRLGPNALNTRMLRTPEAHELVNFARELVETTDGQVVIPQPLQEA